MIHVDAGHRALAHADAGAAIAGDDAAEELEEIGIVADQQHAFAVGILLNQLLESGIIGVRPQRRADLDLGLVAQFSTDKLRGLQGTLEGAGDDDVDLHLERAQQPRHEHALLLAFLDQAPFGVEDGIAAGESGIGVAHEIEVHWIGLGVLRGRSANSLEADFNTVVTFWAGQDCSPGEQDSVIAAEACQNSLTSSPPSTLCCWMRVNPAWRRAVLWSGRRRTLKAGEQAEGEVEACDQGVGDEPPNQPRGTAKSDTTQSADGVTQARRRLPVRRSHPW